MGKFVKALTVAAMLAVAMLAYGADASADGGGKGKSAPTLPAPAPLTITWESAPADLSGGDYTLSITWE